MTYTPVTLISQKIPIIYNNLNEDENYEGDYIDMSDYSNVQLNIISDVDSAICGVEVRFSTHNYGEYNSKYFTYYATREFNIVIPIIEKYIKVLYKNGSIAQNSFKLSILGHITPNDNTTNLPNTSAFGRLRVCSPISLLTINHILDINNIQETGLTTGTGTINLVEGKSAVRLSISNGGSVIRQSRLKGCYQAGKSLMFLASGILSESGNCTSRIGYYDGSDGLYFEWDNGFFICKKSFGVVLRIPQDKWNIDRMDGSGMSNIILDKSKVLIFLIDLEWLGSGRVRYGFVIGGLVIYVHELLHANIADGEYMFSANLPIRYELVGGVEKSGSMQNICSTILCEGEYVPKGRRFSIHSNVVTISDTIKPILSVRMTSNKICLKLERLMLLESSPSSVIYYIYLFQDKNASDILSSSNWNSCGIGSFVEYDKSATDINIEGGLLLQSGFATEVVELNLTDQNICCGWNLNNQSDIIIVCSKGFLVNQKISAALSWIEIV